MTTTSNATRADELLIEGLDRPVPGTARFTWCTAQASGPAR